MTTLDPKKRMLADFSLLIVALLWGGGFVAVKDGLNGFTPMYLMAFRFIIAFFFVFLAFFPYLKNTTKAELKGGAVIGLFLFLAFATQTIGLQYTTASKQGFLTATYVVMVPFLYWLIHRKRPSTKVFFASFLTLTGLGIIGLDTALSLNGGDLLTLVCAFFFASHILSIERFAGTVDVRKLSVIQMGVACVLFLFSAWIFEPAPDLASVSLGHWGSVVYLGIFSTFICFSIQTIAQKFTTSSHASIIMSFESVFAAVLGVVLLSEPMTSSILIGSSFIFGSILLVEIRLPDRNRFLRALKNDSSV